eukprot:CAMPEP_0119571596 /NCGR_PEP_ID=MMETSP1352-20130426/44200_1 /TAXON_ID=265584 /ORGANISM="Stauroneis constricta, Strain CCMP1120" /LENGTH=876 /DNA_ID=CAMNT_0007621279 /DNA_START=39 /DNA_END=2670 /DNA_ORIENTATION=-
MSRIIPAMALPHHSSVASTVLQDGDELYMASSSAASASAARIRLPLHKNSSIRADRHASVEFDTMDDLLRQDDGNDVIEEVDEEFEHDGSSSGSHDNDSPNMGDRRRGRGGASILRRRDVGGGGVGKGGRSLTKKWVKRAISNIAPLRPKRAAKSDPTKEQHQCQQQQVETAGVGLQAKGSTAAVAHFNSRDGNGSSSSNVNNSNATTAQPTNISAFQPSLISLKRSQANTATYDGSVDSTNGGWPWRLKVALALKRKDRHALHQQFKNPPPVDLPTECHDEDDGYDKHAHHTHTHKYNHDNQWNPKCEQTSTSAFNSSTTRATWQSTHTDVSSQPSTTPTTSPSRLQRQTPTAARVAIATTGRTTADTDADVNANTNANADAGAVASVINTDDGGDNDQQQDDDSNDSIAMLTSMIRSTRLDTSTNRSLMHRQRAQVFGRDSIAQARWGLSPAGSESSISVSPQCNDHHDDNADGRLNASGEGSSNRNRTNGSCAKHNSHDDDDDSDNDDDSQVYPNLVLPAWCKANLTPPTDDHRHELSIHGNGNHNESRSRNPLKLISPSSASTSTSSPPVPASRHRPIPNYRLQHLTSAYFHNVDEMEESGPITPSASADADAGENGAYSMHRPILIGGATSSHVVAGGGGGDESDWSDDSDGNDNGGYQEETSILTPSASADAGENGAYSMQRPILIGGVTSSYVVAGGGGDGSDWSDDSDGNGNGNGGYQEETSIRPGSAYASVVSTGRVMFASSVLFPSDRREASSRDCGYGRDVGIGEIGGYVGYPVGKGSSASDAATTITNTTTKKKQKKKRQGHVNSNGHGCEHGMLSRTDGDGCFLKYAAAKARKHRMEERSVVEVVDGWQAATVATTDKKPNGF